MAAMAVKDESLHHATNHLILEKPQKFYSTLIHDRASGNHWQLRSLINSPNKNIVYYPSGFNVYALNTKTRERSIIATLSFSPRCIAASKNWICCGGEKGDQNYAAICLSDRGTSPLFLDQNSDPDARLPLDLDPSRRSTLARELNINTSSRARDDTRPAVVKYLRLGKEIINSITIWAPKERIISNKAYHIPVAVVSINDCSVRILNLHTSEVLEKLELPDCVNRSVISPDGKLLVNVCDDPFLYIHERKPKLDRKEDVCSSNQSYEWVLACKIQLEGQKLSDRSVWRGSFTACFSSSQKYLAVATQYGIISVFDTEEGVGFGSVVATFTTSRPEDENGAVRAMEFSPGPFDLLAWTESSGRIGVADVRNLFLSRQLLHLDHSVASVERISVIDSPFENFLDPRLRNFGTDSPNNNTPDYLGIDSERRLLRLMDNHQTSGELEVLAAHREARRRRDAVAISEASAPSRWSALDPWNEGQRVPSSTSAASDERNGSVERRISIAGLPASLREFVNGDRSQASIRSFINERNRENERRSQQQHEPRRRGSMILAAVQNEIERHERDSLGLGASRNGNDTASGLERLTLSQSRAQGDWSTEIDTLYGSRFAADPPAERSARLRIEFEDNGRDFAHRLRQPWRPMDELSHVEAVRNRSAAFHQRSDPLATNGCCWSEDGRILYAAIEDGIFEFHVNIMGRKKFPSLVLR